MEHNEPNEKIGKCSINGVIQIYKFFIYPTTYALEIEQEASKILSHSCFCKVNSLVMLSESKTLLMDAVSGPTLLDFLQTQPQTLGLLQMAHVLATVQLMHDRSITHGDLHLENILITPTPLKTITYRLKDQMFIIKTHGYHPVVMNLGLAFIPTFKYKPAITMEHAGNVCFNHFEPRFDLARLLLHYAKVLLDQPEADRCQPFTTLALAINKTVRCKTGLEETGLFLPHAYPKLAETVKNFLLKNQLTTANLYTRPFISLLLNVQQPTRRDKLTGPIVQHAIQYLHLVAQCKTNPEFVILCKQAIDTDQTTIKTAMGHLAGAFNIVIKHHTKKTHAGVSARLDKMVYQTGFQWLRIFLDHALTTDGAAFTT